MARVLRRQTRPGSWLTSDCNFEISRVLSFPKFRNFSGEIPEILENVNAIKSMMWVSMEDVSCCSFQAVVTIATLGQLNSQPLTVSLSVSLSSHNTIAQVTYDTLNATHYSLTLKIISLILWSYFKFQLNNDVIFAVWYEISWYEPSFVPYWYSDTLGASLLVGTRHGTQGGGSWEGIEL